MVEIYPIAKLVIDEIFTNMLLCYISQILNTVYCLMTITKNLQIQTEIVQNQENQRKTKEALGGLRQDNGGFDRRAFALRQPAAVTPPSARRE
jgi:hypothetical protein